MLIHKHSLTKQHLLLSRLSVRNIQSVSPVPGHPAQWAIHKIAVQQKRCCEWAQQRALLTKADLSSTTDEYVTCQKQRSKPATPIFFPGGPASYLMAAC